MLVIGEKINTINPRIRQAVEDRDALFLRDLALAQAQAVDPPGGLAQALAGFTALALQQPDFPGQEEVAG